MWQNEGKKKERVNVMHGCGGVRQKGVEGGSSLEHVWWCARWEQWQRRCGQYSGNWNGWKGRWHWTTVGGIAWQMLGIRERGRGDKNEKSKGIW
jgi:hypothetical protein